MVIPNSVAEAKKRMLSNVAEKDQVKKAGKQENQGETIPYDPFDLKKLEQVMGNIILEFKKGHKNLELTVVKQPFELQGEQITFLLHGDLQKDIFQKLKPELLGILKKALNNYRITLDMRIEDDSENSGSRLYTSTDKLNYLKEKNPALKELQKRFGLEVDF
ncbi:DNA polymerase III subunit gamma/tau [Pararhodonellum marinum]|uniref:DNA polymerase III subunit gamma/tau n=1 Tax=Pararhodonellum marinum TaxID=2755358 RepID=UPI00188E4E6A|nr:DNA polymerase III subunit gamma/tau [Pararhodonellum marinum]